MSQQPREVQLTSKSRFDLQEQSAGHPRQRVFSRRATRFDSQFPASRYALPLPSTFLLHKFSLTDPHSATPSHMHRLLMEHYSRKYPKTLTPKRKNHAAKPIRDSGIGFRSQRYTSSVVGGTQLLPVRSPEARVTALMNCRY